MLMMKERRPAIRTLQGWAISVLLRPVSIGLRGLARVPVWVVAAVKPALPLPAPLIPIRLPPRSVKLVVTLKASGALPVTLCKAGSIVSMTSQSDGSPCQSNRKDRP